MLVEYSIKRLSHTPYEVLSLTKSHQIVDLPEAEDKARSSPETTPPRQLKRRFDDSFIITGSTDIDSSIIEEVN